MMRPFRDMGQQNGGVEHQRPPPPTPPLGGGDSKQSKFQYNQNSRLLADRGHSKGTSFLKLQPIRTHVRGLFWPVACGGPSLPGPQGRSSQAVPTCPRGPRALVLPLPALSALCALALQRRRPTQPVRARHRSHGTGEGSQLPPFRRR
jgi:hypothetical protein